MRGAFAQTYRPLEIVISDDGSSDGSWEYLQKAVAQFRLEHGDVSVILNHNDRNLGNLGNWQKCCELSHGEMLIKADGDDVSLPERTTKVMESWIRGGKRAKMISCAAWAISPSGKRVNKVAPPTIRLIRGAMCAWSRDCYSSFSQDSKYPRVFDDHVYASRVEILGGETIQLPEILVLYRLGSGASTSIFNLKKQFLGQIHHRLESRRQVKCDLSEHDSDSVRQWLNEECRRQLCRRTLITGSSFCIRHRALRRLMKLSPCRRLSALYFQRLCFVLPFGVGMPILFGYAMLNYCRKRFMRLRDERFV